MWKGETAYIIGGGPSLKSFDFTRIERECAIGCNDAYRLGNWVSICYFGDKEWFELHQPRPEFQSFTGLKIACTPFPIPGVLSLERNLDDTLYLEGTKIGWFCNTGASAVNLAIRLGATKIVLLGFDMKLGNDGQSNWHPNLVNPSPTGEVYANFKYRFNLLATLIKKLRPDVKVINANPDSELDCFPRMSFEESLNA